MAFEHGTAGEWNTQIVDLSSVDYWAGTIYGLRLDYFAGNGKAGEYMDIEYVAFAKTLEEAQSYADGTAVLPEVPPESTDIKTTTAGGFVIEGDYILGVKPGSVAYDVIGGLTGAKLEVFDDEGNSVRNQTVYTGYKVATYNTALEKCDELTLVIAGDVNFDGEVDSLDAAQILKHDASITTLSELQLLAGDVNLDGEVDSLDAAWVLKVDAGIIKL